MSGYALPVTKDDSSPIVRAKRKMAEAHLKVAEGEAYQAALTVLVQVMMGKDAAGNPIKSSARDRVQAAKALLRSAAETFEAHKDAPEAPSVNITIGVPEIIRVAERLKGASSA